MEERIKKVFTQAFGFDANSFTSDLTPDQVPGWDSLGHLRLVNELQEEFKIEFDVTEVMEMDAVCSIIKILEQKSVSEK